MHEVECCEMNRQVKGYGWQAKSLKVGLPLDKSVQGMQGLFWPFHRKGGRVNPQPLPCSKNMKNSRFKQALLILLFKNSIIFSIFFN